MIVALPNASAAGVKVSVPFEATAGATLKSAAFVLPVTLNVSVWPASSAGPALSAVAHPASLYRPLSSSTVTSAPFVKLGASLRGVTLSVTVPSSLESRRPSLTRYVKLSGPW